MSLSQNEYEMLRRIDDNIREMKMILKKLCEDKPKWEVYPLKPMQPPVVPKSKYDDYFVNLPDQLKLKL